MNDLSKACLDEAKNSMKSSLSFLDKELAKIRAGKANPGMLDGVKVDYYGTMTEISQVANINTPDAAASSSNLGRRLWWVPSTRPYWMPTWASPPVTKAKYFA